MIKSNWLIEVYFFKYVTGKKRTGPPQKYLQKTCGDLCHLEGKLTSWNFLDYATSEVILNESNRTDLQHLMSPGQLHKLVPVVPRH